MSNENATGDLNNVIASAVQARIETEVATALAGSELMTQYVAAALNQPIEVGDRFKSRKTTFLRETIDKAIREATKDAVQKAIAAELPAIEAQVTAELRRNVKGIAKTMTDKLGEKVDSAYGVTVKLNYPDPDR